MNKIIPSTTTCVIALFVIFSASAAVADQFVCEAIGDGYYTVKISTKDPSYATANYVLGGDGANQSDSQSGIAMRAAPSNSGFRYIGKGVELSGANNTAMLTDTGAGETVKCRLGQQRVAHRNTGSNQKVDLSVLNARGFSLGGKVRAGPGIEHQKIGSIRGKTSIVIVKNTGVKMDGYYWFQIREKNGDGGYQWGGIICSDTHQVVGVYKTCN